MAGIVVGHSSRCRESSQSVEKRKKKPAVGTESAGTGVATAGPETLSEKKRKTTTKRSPSGAVLGREMCPPTTHVLFRCADGEDNVTVTMPARRRYCRGNVLGCWKVETRESAARAPRLTVTAARLVPETASAIG